MALTAAERKKMEAESDARITKRKKQSKKPVSGAQRAVNNMIKAGMSKKKAVKKSTVKKPMPATKKAVKKKATKKKSNIFIERTKRINNIERKAGK